MEGGGKYEGSTIFTGLAGYVRLPLDQVNFLACQLFCLTFAYVFRTTFSPLHTSVAARQILSTTIGLTIGFFCYGRNSMFYWFLQVFPCYGITRFFPASSVHICVFFVAMTTLLLSHVYRMVYDYGGYTMDVTGSLMISTQKLTSLAFALHDGLCKKEDNLSDDQKQQAIRKPPSVLEYLSYIFCFHAVLVGPMCFYNDYHAFINGDNLKLHQCHVQNQQNGASNTQECKPLEMKHPSPTSAVYKKLSIGFVSVMITFLFAPMMPKMRNADLDFISSTSFTYRIVFLMISVSLARCKYYFAWNLGEAINNCAGLGFSGYDSQGRSKWDLLNNVDIVKLETATSLKTLVDSWNMQTSLWLRRICYDRTHSMGLTYTLSAAWHGFYPGYYFTFIAAIFFTRAARLVRRIVRPHFQTTTYLQLFYDVVTWFFAQLSLAYLIVPFTILKFWPTVYFYHYSMGWYLHIIVFITLAVLSNPQFVKMDKSKTH